MEKYYLRNQKLKNARIVFSAKDQNKFRNQGLKVVLGNLVLIGASLAFAVY